MDSQRWRAIRTVFDELVELEPGERARRLAATAAGDPELRREIEALLESDAEAEGWLAGTMFGLISLAGGPEPALPDGPVPDSLGLSGRMLAHFRVGEPIGAGGMGVVYRAEDTRLSRPVALKVPRHHLDSSTKRRFLHEARSAGTLDHPNLCTIYEAGESEDGLLFMAMGLYPGETLKARLAREGALPVAQAFEIARQIALGLTAADQAGIVHRDLKPGNVMLLPDGIVKILDFGLAKVRDLSLTETRRLLGTAAYMAPEQIQGDPVDRRTDLWSLGVVLYEMLTGRQPFQGEHEVSIAHAIVHQEPPRPGELRSEIPPPVEDLVLTLLEKDPERRHATAQEVGADLAAIQSGRHPPQRHRWASRRATTVFRRLWGGSSRRIAMGLAGGLLLTAGAFGAYQSLRPEPVSFEPNLLAVAPFDVPDSSLQFWREGLVDILSLDLDGAGPLRTVPQTVVLRRWSGRADRASAAELGERTGAELVVFGHLARRGLDSVGLRATVLDRSSGTTLGDLGVVGAEGRMGELTDSLGIHILRAIGQGRPIGAVRKATIGARALPVLKEFLRGEEFYRHGLYDSALVHYHQAVTRDPGFALGLRRTAQAAERAATQARYEPYWEYRRRAIALNRGLAPRDSLLLLADSLWLATTETRWTTRTDVLSPSASGSSRTAKTLATTSSSPAADPDGFIRPLYEHMAALKEAARRFPDDPNIWYELGDRLYHLPPPLGGPPARTLEAFEHAIALDPGFGPDYEHVLDLALQLRRPARAAHYARNGAALVPGNEASHLRLTGWVLDSGVEAPTVTRALAAASGNDLWYVGFLDLRWATDTAEAAVAVLRRFAEGDFDEDEAGVQITDPLLRRQHLALALAFRGRLRAAAGLETSLPAAPLAAFVSARVDPFLELALFDALPDSVARRAFDRGLRADADWGGPRIPPSGGLPHHWLPRHLRGAPWWLAQRDTASLHRFAARALRASRYARDAESSVTPLRARYLQATATAYLVLARGDSSEAARILGTIPDTLCLVATCFYEKVTLARLLAARGEEREAAALLDRWGSTADAIPSAVLAALDRARIAERLRDTATALDRYRFVAEAWHRADPELQRYVAEARAGVARLANSN